MTVLQDVKYACRLLVKDPTFTGVALLTLALGIGATTAVFSVVNTMLLKPLPFPAAERIVFPWRQAPHGVDVGFRDLPWSRRDVLQFGEETRTFESFGAFLGDWMNLTGAGDATRLGVARVSAGVLPSLGVAPALGRIFTAEEDRPGSEREVILSHRLWQSRFGGDAASVGRAIDLNGAAYTIVGVMPAGFDFPRSADMPGIFTFPPEPDAWVPLALPPGPTRRGEPAELAVIGKLRPAVSIREAQADLDAFEQRMDREFPAGKGWFASRVTPLTTQAVGDTRRPLVLLFAAVGVVLLIACSNVANLFLNRSMGRSRELAVRAAIGASSGRLVQQLFIECVLLAIAGGAAGVLIASFGVDLMKQLGPAGLPALRDVVVDRSVLVFALAASMASGLFVGLAPVAVIDTARLSRSLHEGGARAGASARGRRLRRTLVAAQLALAVVLLVASGLLVRTFVRMLRADGGFDAARAEHVLTFELTLPQSRYPDADRIARFYDAALPRIAGVPSVQASGLAETIPLGGPTESTVLRIPGRAATRDEERPFSNYTIVSAGYFAAVGAPLLRGRDFGAGDIATSQPVAIVNRAMAERFWPGQSAIGKAVGIPIMPVDMTVVGVVADIKHATLRETPGPEVYVPYTQKPWPSMQTLHVAVRTKGDAAASTAAIRQAVAAIDPGVPLANVAPLDAIVSNAVAQPRFSMFVVSAFGGVALLLACIGLYGTMSHVVLARTSEFGLRVALGAQRSDVMRMVLHDGAALAVSGVAAGATAAAIGTRAMRSFLYGVEPTDPLTFAAVIAALVAVAALACYLPARRAMRIDPLIAMRAD
ncbi:MAG TPA: ABC transporter permease [Vicinamibacterales bacterium]|nr:ABC transporter permease [Vicinamibacterales bacterium]